MNSDRAQAKPSTDRCSYQASGRRECGAREQRPRPHDDCRTATEPRKPSAVNMPPGCLSGPKKPAVAAGCAGPARRHGRQRRARLVNITPTAGKVSVGRYSSTAVPAKRFTTVVALVRQARSGLRRDRTPSSVRLRQSQAGSAARASQAADVNAPAACLQSDRAAADHRGWLR